MKWDDVFCHTFKALKRQMAPELKHQVDYVLPSMPMVETCRSREFDFFRPYVGCGMLSVEDMHQAADRYFLGKTKTGMPIFWMIDDMMQPLDAHIGERWISRLLKNREPLLECWQVTHCLFGLHLLDGRGEASPPTPLQGERGGECKPMKREDGRGQTDDGRGQGSRPVAIVESEASAVVLSALFPEYCWMAYATTLHLSADLFAPLEGCSVTIFPRTDPTMNTFLFFEELADVVQRQYDIDIYVDSTLEEHATQEQKEREIDVLEFITQNENYNSMRQ